MVISEAKGFALATKLDSIERITTRREANKNRRGDVDNFIVGLSITAIFDTSTHELPARLRTNGHRVKVVTVSYNRRAGSDATEKVKKIR